LSALRKAVAGGSAADFAAGLYRYLETVQAGANLIRFAEGLPQPEQKVFVWTSNPSSGML
jgi:hypothetical protein